LVFQKLLGKSDFLPILIFRIGRSAEVTFGVWLVYVAFEGVNLIPLKIRENIYREKRKGEHIQRLDGPALHNLKVASIDISHIFDENTNFTLFFSKNRFLANFAGPKF